MYTLFEKCPWGEVPDGAMARGDGLSFHDTYVVANDGEVASSPQTLSMNTNPHAQRNATFQSRGTVLVSIRGDTRSQQIYEDDSKYLSPGVVSHVEYGYSYAVL